MKISNLGNINPDSVTNIIFDWGGVITQIDFDIAIEAFKQLGYEGFSKREGSYPQNTLMEKFEIGQIGPEVVIDFLRKEPSIQANENDLWQAWNSLLLDTPSDHIQILKELGKKYNLALLSNTNIIHTSYYRNMLRTRFQIDFFTLFKKTYLSYELGMRKPNADIFEYVVQDSGFRPEETLFIDDLESNIEAADKCNFLCLHHQKNTSLKPVFHPWLDQVR